MSSNVEPTPARTETIVVGPHRIRVQTEGDGPPLLLLMGIGGNAEMWDPLRQHLSGRRLIAFDVPGTGGSSTPVVPLPMVAIADIAVGVLRHLGIERADVLGVSWGGVLAQTLAIRHPKSVGRLVLAATLFGLGSFLGRPSALWILATPRRYYSRSYLDRVAPTLYGGRIRREPEIFRQQTAARLTRPPSMRGYVGQVFAINSISTLPFARCIKSPTLILAGSDDPMVPVVNSRILQRAIPHATLQVVEGGGHLFLLDSAAEVAPVIEQFLAAEDVGPS
jgi:poly(3-hydroxyoctanoate) depolymerase